MQTLVSQNLEVNQRLDNEKAILRAIQSKLDTTLTKLTQCHQEAIRLQSNTDSRLRLMINTNRIRN